MVNQPLRKRFGTKRYLLLMKIKKTFTLSYKFDYKHNIKQHQITCFKSCLTGSLISLASPSLSIHKIDNFDKN